MRFLFLRLRVRILLGAFYYVVERMKIMDDVRLKKIQERMEFGALTADDEMYLQEVLSPIVAGWNQVKEVLVKVAEWLKEKFFIITKYLSKRKDLYEKQSFLNIRHMKVPRLKSQALLNKPRYIQARSSL